MRRWNRSTWPAVSTMFCVPGVERMAIGADLDPDRLGGRADREGVAAHAVDLAPDGTVGWISVFMGSPGCLRRSSGRSGLARLTTLTRFLSRVSWVNLTVPSAGGEERVIASHPDVLAGVERAPALPNDDRARVHALSIAALHAEPLARRCRARSAGRAGLLVCHCLLLARVRLRGAAARRALRLGVGRGLVPWRPPRRERWGALRLRIAGRLGRRRRRGPRRRRSPSASPRRRLRSPSAGGLRGRLRLRLLAVRADLVDADAGEVLPMPGAAAVLHLLLELEDDQLRAELLAAGRWRSRRRRRRGGVPTVTSSPSPMSSTRSKVTDRRRARHAAAARR